MSVHGPFDLADIQSILPHRAPFLFVDRVTCLEPNQSIEAERLLRPEEPQFAGHFPGQAMMPGVLVGEALAQASGLLIGLSMKIAGEPPARQRVAFVLASANLKFTRPALPGETLVLRAAMDRNLGGLFRFNVEGAVGADVVTSGSLMLSSFGGSPS